MLWFSPLRKLSMLSLFPRLVTTDLSSKTELLEESVPSEIVFVVLVVGLNYGIF